MGKQELIPVVDRQMDIEKLTRAYESVKISEITGRIIAPETVLELGKSCGERMKERGTSVLGRPIISVEVGNGPKKVLLWTQMHGNEPTATGAAFDLIRFLTDPPAGYEGFVDKVKKAFHLMFIPMLNPDGAALFRRTNALDIDLNRDALALNAPESRVLREVRDGFAPEYCFNLHDQRNIYNVAGTPRPATVSFLAPAEDEQRSVTSRRKQSMAVIGAMNRAIRQIVPGGVGRYSDEFYPTATGDNFQKDGYVTMLIESGAYPGDPERQITRLCNFAAILSALEFLMETTDLQAGWEQYESIPQNDTKMMDVILRNTGLTLGNCRTKADIGILFSEKPSADGEKMECRAVVESIGDLRFYHGMAEVDAGGRNLAGYDGKCPQVGDEIGLPVCFSD